MKEYLTYLVIGIIVILFLYFGYKDDFKRNPKSFFKTIFGVPIGILSHIFNIGGIPNLIRKWIRKEEQ